ncbi:MAG: hypothetical protein ACOH1Y_15490 [Propionicimonas sp.]
MSENLRDLAAELNRVDAAIHDVPLYADPTDPTSSFSDQLVDLIAREDALIGLMIQQARAEVSRDEPAPAAVSGI